VSGLSLLVSPARAAAALNVGTLDRLAEGYARFCGVRNVVAGALLLALAYVAGVAHAAGPALVVVGAAAWAITQLADVFIFLRLDSRAGALAAGVLALALGLAALLAWLG
jgi:hypothetical protein